MTFQNWIFVASLSLPLFICALVASGLGIRLNWLRRLIRIAGVVGVALSTLFILIATDIRFSGSRALRSPDGQFICHVQEAGGFGTGDFNRIEVRRTWSPIAEEIFYGEGAYDPKLRWVDQRTIEIEYPNQFDPEKCDGSGSGVRVLCKAAPREEFFPVEKPK
jgi:hypothetical protein